MDEMRMLKRMPGVPGRDRLRGAMKVVGFTMKLQESRLRWSSHITRKDTDYVGKTVREIERETRSG